MFLQNFNDDLLLKYNIDVNSIQLEINSDVAEIINFSNNLNLSKEFITYILYVYLNDTFSLLGNIEDVLLSKNSNARNRHIWSNFYLVKKEIASAIDFNALVNDIEKRTRNRIEESYSFYLKSYLSKFLIQNNIEILDSILPIAEEILNNEFQL